MCDGAPSALEVGAIGALTALPVTAAFKVIFRFAFRNQLGRIDSEIYHGRGVYPGGPVTGEDNHPPFEPGARAEPDADR